MSHPFADFVDFHGIKVRKATYEADVFTVKDVYLQDAYKTALLDARAFNVVVDVGAHLGSFARLWHDKNPAARIICVEVAEENIPVLTANVGHFATILHAACTYEPGEVGLYNSIQPGCINTGGSLVLPIEAIRAGVVAPAHAGGVRPDFRPIRKVTLEDIHAEFGLPHIDLLKLDCEGSEFSILEHADLSKVHFVVGEYHDTPRWEKMLRTRLRYFDYGHMFASGGLGLFHLANKVWPPVPVGSGRVAARAVALPVDFPLLEMYGGYYDRLYDTVRASGVKTAVEVGVGAGYSAAALFAAGVEQVIGIVSDGDSSAAGFYCNAKEKFAGHNFTLLLADSCSLSEFPQADLVVMEGRRDYHTAVTDLPKAMAAAPLVWCDDYYSGGGMKKAVDEVLAANPVWRLESVDLHNRDWKAVLLRKVRRKLLRIAVPSGIGDALWPLVKLAALLKREGADAAVVDAEETALPRTKDFLEHFDFVARSGYSRWHLTEADPHVLPDGTYNYAPPQPHWHNEFDWMLQANGHLERGGHLADWLPDLEPEWDVAKRFQFRAEELVAADDFAGEIGGPFVLMFAASEQANTTAGHNRGPLWTPAEWAELCRLFLEKQVRPVFIGAEWDRSYFDKHLRLVLPDGVMERIGRWPIGVTFAVAKRSVGLVAYQSGLGIFAVYLGVPCAMWWRPDGNSIHPSLFISFRETMAHSWAPPGAVESGRYVPLIYTRCSPASIFAHAKDHWLSC